MARKSRKEIYLETQTFHYHNENPKNRITTDCVIRAIATATKKGYQSTLEDIYKFQSKTYYAINSPEGMDKYLKSIGWEKMNQPKKANGKKYTGKEWCLALQKIGSTKNIIANIGGHHTVAIAKGKIYDIWDSTNGCIGNYWIER